MPKRSTRMRRAIGIAVLTLVITVPLSGCGISTPNTSTANGAVSLPSPSSTSEPTDVPVAPTETSPVEANGAPPTDAPPTDDPATDDPATESGGSSATPAILATESAGKILTLADFFQPDSNWSGNRFDVADRRQVQGIGTDVSECSRNSAKTLELRLANNFKSLQINVAQANNSTLSDQRLIVEVVGNNSQIDIRRIPFNVVQKITIPVTNVNALQILLYMDDKISTCGTGSVSAVLFNAVLG